ncbi:hypothetical protein GGX14DRAFT_457583 [Mycena pura]|uniref:Transmembrane protein n=1 Tax=Mycena pura TaxID=153505 RepID=A0AAD6V9X7_9AGAR|nr:hypothetical protein GGX14DRAFT_457583 [Mycena pura]
MTTNVAIVDERDPLVHYAGSWQDGGVGEEFNGTTRFTTTQGSTASFTFVGTSVAVFGTVAAIDPPQASMEFVIDDTIQGTYTPPSNMTADVHHATLYTSPTLSNGTHTLVITQTAAQAAGVIFLDYIMYNTTSTDVEQYFIDDRDPRIQYDPPWEMFGSETDFQHTSQASPSTGASFTLQFDGRGISYYGAINNGSAGQVMNASMVVDGGPPVFFVPPIQSAALTVNNLIFNSGDLSSGNHTLVVTAENDHNVWVDYFLVIPPIDSTSTSAPASSSSASSGGTASSSKAVPIGVIVGPLVGGLLLLALLGIGLFYLHRRRRRHREISPPTREALDRPGPATVITPFSGLVSSQAATAGSSYTYRAVSSTDASNVASNSNPSNVASEEVYDPSSLYATSASASPFPAPAPVPAPARAPISRKLANEARYAHRPSSSDARSTDAGPSIVHGGEIPPIYTE